MFGWFKKSNKKVCAFDAMIDARSAGLSEALECGEYLRCKLAEVKASGGAMSVPELQATLDAMWLKYHYSATHHAFISTIPILLVRDTLDKQKNNPYRKLRYC